MEVGTVTSTSSFPFLTIIVLLPLISGLVLAFVPTSRDKLARSLALAVSLVEVVFAVAILGMFKTGDASYQLVSRHEWMGTLGISWSLGIDGVSLFLVILVTVLFPIVFVGAIPKANKASFVSWLLILEGACLGSFLSLDAFEFFIYFELTLIPTYFIVVGWGGAKRNAAAVKFFIYTLFGSAFLFVGILVIAAMHYQQTGILTFDISQLATTHMSYTTQVLLFLSFTVAFLVKTPVFPFHTWSPDAYSESPIAGAIIMSGVMAKLGTYGILRFDLNLFPKASWNLAPLLLTLAVIGIIYGAVVAAGQKDFKRLVAYSSLSHLGFIILGIFAFSSQGLSGGVLQMFNHGIVTAGMFLIIGFIAKRTGTWQLTRLKGIQRVAPVLAGAMMIVVLAGLGLPGLNGFVGEFLILLGTFVTHRWWAVVALGGVILSAVYLLWAYQRAFHGSPSEELSSKIKELKPIEALAMAPLIAFIFFIGVYPQPMLDKINPTVTQIVARVDKANNISVNKGPIPNAITQTKKELTK